MAPPRAADRATGIAIAPTLRNFQKLMSMGSPPGFSPSGVESLRRASSQRMVASEPVTERLGPRSTPMRTALAMRPWVWEAWMVAPAIRPSGRLLTRLLAMPTVKPTTRLPRFSPSEEARASQCWVS